MRGSLRKLLELRFLRFNQGQQKKEIHMKRIEKQFIGADGGCTTGSVATCFQGRGMSAVKVLYNYNSCRGFITDMIRYHLQKQVEEKKPMTLGFASHMYLVEAVKRPIGNNKLSKKSFMLTKELCKRLGYKEPEHYEGKICNIFKIDMRLFKNVYAGSMLFMFYKYPDITRLSKDVEDFVNRRASGTAKVALRERLFKLFDNWEEIFPVKEHTWKSMQGSNHKTKHHYEGLSELLKGHSKFDHVRDRANKILGGVKEVKMTHNDYGNAIFKVTGEVTDQHLMFY